MARMAKSAIDAAVLTGEHSVLVAIDKRKGHSLSARDIWEAAQSGDILASGIVSATGEKLGEALAILIDLFNPECIVIGGLVLRMGEALLGPARAVVAKEALSCAADVCKIVPAALGEQVGDVAALCVALEGLRLAK